MPGWLAGKTIGDGIVSADWQPSTAGSNSIGEISPCGIWQLSWKTMSGEGTGAESPQVLAVNGISQAPKSEKVVWMAGADMGGAMFGYGNCDIMSIGNGVAGGDATLIGMGCDAGKNCVVVGCADRQYPPSLGEVGSKWCSVSGVIGVGGARELVDTDGCSIEDISALVELSDAGSVNVDSLSGDR